MWNGVERSIGLSLQSVFLEKCLHLLADGDDRSAGLSHNGNLLQQKGVPFLVPAVTVKGRHCDWHCPLRHIRQVARLSGLEEEPVPVVPGVGKEGEPSGSVVPVPEGTTVEYAFRAGYDSMGRVSVTFAIFGRIYCNPSP